MHILAFFLIVLFMPSSCAYQYVTVRGDAYPSVIIKGGAYPFVSIRGGAYPFVIIRVVPTHLLLSGVVPTRLFLSGVGPVRLPPDDPLDPLEFSQDSLLLGVDVDVCKKVTVR